jgi:hypothetical protein
MMEGTVPVPPAPPALRAMRMYYQFWSYHIRQSLGSGDETPVSDQVFYDFSRANFNVLFTAKR